MKSCFTLLLISLCFTCLSRSTNLDHLASINKCWLEQSDLPANLQLPKHLSGENEWIRLHLRLVEETLRSRSTRGLSPAQISRRMQSLDDLHAYWQAGRFPINDEYTYRTPIFIDSRENFCAVGYLVKASGHEAVSRMIAAKTNTAYVREMSYPELAAWADRHGFSIDELAWIQPAYSPVQAALPVGKGVDGEVRELYVDNEQARLYVGGNFSRVDSTIGANNIAYITESGGLYTWHSLGSGVNGTVHAITKHGGKIYVAGSFSMAGGVPVNNVACWDGNAWSAAGCIYGTVFDLAVMNDELYAAGAFDVCAAMADVNLARWNGTNWQQVPGLSGRVNTVQVMDTTLVLGGTFSFNGAPANAMRWSAGAGFRPFGAAILNEVKDFEVFKDTLYAICNRTSTADTLNLILKLEGESWAHLTPNTHLQFFAPADAGLSFNTLCRDGEDLMLGGSFRYLPMIGTMAENCINIAAPGGISGRWFLVDSTVHKMVIFKNSLIAGGNFKKGFGSRPGMPGTVTLNGIAHRASAPTSVPGEAPELVVDWYPNPLKAGQSITLSNNFRANSYTLRDMSGRKTAQGALQPGIPQQQVCMPSLTPGVYLLEISNSRGDRRTKRLALH